LTILDEISPRCFDFIINHVFLPPQLPQHADDSANENTSELLRLLLHCSEVYSRQLSTSNCNNSQWPAVIQMMQCFVKFENTGLSAQVFSTAVMGMKDGGIIHFLLSSSTTRLTDGWLMRLHWSRYHSSERGSLSTSGGKFGSRHILRGFSYIGREAAYIVSRPCLQCALDYNDGLDVSGPVRWICGEDEAT